MRKLWMVLIIFFSVVLLVGFTTGCRREEDNPKEDEIVIEEENDEEERESEEEDEVEEETEVDDSVNEVEEMVSPLSGIYAKKEKVSRRVVATMFDNHPRARWQSGLSEAEVVYEFLVEAPYTRYMGLYLLNEPEFIGPIRSSRPYFVTTLLEYDPIYVRVGGSVAANRDVDNYNIADINGITAPNKVLWRNRNINKNAPHNTYTSMSAVRGYGKERGYRLQGDYKGFKFYGEKETDDYGEYTEGKLELDGFSAEKISINYFSNNNTSYNYNEKEKIYYRRKDGEAHIDEIDGSPILAKNIIIQEARTKIIDDVGRLEIELVGEGKGKYMTNGKGIPITWSKESREGKTYFFDESGEEISLNPGITWIQVVKTNTNIVIE